jgi:hypothetical protein
VILLLALLAAADPDTASCPVVQRILKSAPAGFSAVKGREQKGLSWTKPARLPLASRCKVIEHNDGSAPFYGCEMHATTCRLTEKKFDELAKELDGCLGMKAEQEDDGTKRTARWRFPDQRAKVRQTFTRGDKCSWAFFVELSKS